MVGTEDKLKEGRTVDVPVSSLISEAVTIAKTEALAAKLPEGSMDAYYLPDELALEIVDKISKGATTVECCWYLMKQKPGISLQVAQKAMNEAVYRIYGTMSHSDWTNMFKSMAQDLYKKAVESGKIGQANQVLNTQVKIQYLAQTADMRSREINHEEAKFKAAIELPIRGEGGKALIESVMAGKSLDSTQKSGFRLQIESYSPTQSMPTENTHDAIDNYQNTLDMPDSLDPGNHLP